MSFRPISALVLCENRHVGKPFLLCLLIGLGVLSPVFGAEPSATSIERYLNAPFASEFIVAPGGGKSPGSSTNVVRAIFG